MWHVYNLVRVGDRVRCTTVRKVTTESNTGSTYSQRVHTVLSISIETVDFDPIACILHLKGRNVAENQHVKMGQYHTLDIDVGKKFKLWKPQWDSIDLDRLDLALDPSRTADVAAVVMHEGLANLCLVTAQMTIVKAKIDMQIPRKRKGLSSHHDKGIQRFYEAIATAFVRHVDMKAQVEVKTLDMFYQLMATDPSRAFYGYKHVLMANQQLAIDTLLLSDSLFRSNDIQLRRKYVELAESVKEQGSNVLIFSSMHVSGEQLSALGGVAAVLRFPLHELEDEQMSDSEHSEDDNNIKN
ncbi:Uncharacterized protein BM_BM5411 [Brugia malayi]|nr:Uncharacterized protein BM_BM5411 [Brugia malayi]VIO92417.1 Uncharacterized protein BM_BM5411 [Brugia malayi]